MSLWLSLFILIRSSRSLNLSFTIGPTNLTYGCSRGAIGYDSTIDAILFYGGYQSSCSRHFSLFKNGHELWGGNYFLRNTTYSHSQQYTQFNHELWMLFRRGTGFIKVDTETHNVTYPSIAIPTSVNRGGCLTSIENYLIVIGSGTTSSRDPPTNLVQIYNIKDGVWFDNAPLLKDDRCYLSCTVLDDNVYAIGGYGLNPSGWYHTIEVLNISNIAHQTFKDWYYFSGSLRTARGETRAVSYGKNIYVIGGNDATGYPTDVNRINTVTGQCDIVAYLAYGVEGSMPLFVGNKLYVFGGFRSWIRDDGDSVYRYEHRYQYALLPKEETDDATSEKAKPKADAALIVAIVMSIIVLICFGLLFVAFRYGKHIANEGSPHRSESNHDRMDIPQNKIIAVESEAPVGVSVTDDKTVDVFDEARAHDTGEGDDENDRQHHKEQTFVIRSESEVPAAPGAPTGGGAGEDNIAEQDVKKWLDSIGCGFYHNAFVSHGFGSMDRVKDINDVNDLKEIGISLEVHQIKILNHIKKLK